MISRVALVASLLIGFTPAFPARHSSAADLSAPVGLKSSEQQIRRALNEDKTSLEFVETPLKEAIEFIRDKHHLEMQFDVAALKAAAVDPTALPVRINVKDITVRSALNLLLSEYNLAPVIKDEVLLITTKDKAMSTLETHIYDVHDLVMREGDMGGLPDFDSLTEIIRTTVNPTSWDKSGGPGSVAGFSNNGIAALVVWQNFEGQGQVESLLARLRMLKPQRAIRQ